MQRLLAFLLIGLLTGTTSIIGLGVPAAEACTIECIALGRAAFAVFNQQLVGALVVPRVAYGPAYCPGYYYPPVYHGARHAGGRRVTAQRAVTAARA
jgi:hypothetical protein